MNVCTRNLIWLRFLSQIRLLLLLFQFYEILFELKALPRISAKGFFFQQFRANIFNVQSLIFSIINFLVFFVSKVANLHNTTLSRRKQQSKKISQKTTKVITRTLQVLIRRKSPTKAQTYTKQLRKYLKTCSRTVCETRLKFN